MSFCQWMCLVDVAVAFPAASGHRKFGRADVLLCADLFRRRVTVGLDIPT